MKNEQKGRMDSMEKENEYEHSQFKKANKKNRHVTCSNCGASFHRDTSAAEIIKRRGIARLDGSDIEPKIKKERKSKYGKRSKPVEPVEAPRPIIDKDLQHLPLFCCA